MKIFHVIHGFPQETAGGTERVVEALATAMADHGHELAIVAGSLQRAPCQTVDEERYQGLRVLRMHRDDLNFESWDKCWSPGVSARFAELLEREKPDIVHVHHWLRLTSELIRVARAAQCVVAVTLHDYYSALASPVRLANDPAPIRPPPHPGYFAAAEAGEALDLHRRDLLDDIRAAHLRFAPSRAHAVGVEELAPGPLGPIHVTQPPLLTVPIGRGRAKERGRRLLTWGSLYPEKGVGEILDALRAVEDSRSVDDPEFNLTVLGEAHDSGYRAELMERARGLRVTFHGAFTTADLQSIEADFAVLPSRCQESYGLTIDEAQCLGLPIIAANLPAYREHVPADSCAFFAAGNAAELAAILRDAPRLDRLVPPPQPTIVTPRAAADLLLDYYVAARVGDHRPYAAAPKLTERERATAMFMRAERRLWTSLQQPNPPAPPE